VAWGRGEGVLAEEMAVEAVEAMATVEAEMATAGEAVEAAGSESEGMASSWQCTVHCTSPRCGMRGHRPA
jgi:hypothetical protein